MKFDESPSKYNKNKMQMDARSINTRAFIAEIQKRPSIWDQTCEDYNNKDQKYDDWQELTMMFIPKHENFSPVEVRSYSEYILDYHVPTVAYYSFCL